MEAIAQELKKSGGDIEVLPDGLVIRGRQWLPGGKVNSWNDHRIAMALAVASIRCRGPVVLEGAECVSKSYPNFWEDYNRLGGSAYE